MKVLKTSAIAIITLLLIIMTGCSTAKSPKEAMISGLTKIQKAKSMTFKGSLSLDDIVIPQSGSGPNAAMTDMMFKMLKGADVQFHGAMQADPQRAEIVMDLGFGTSDMKINVSVPVIITKEKVWIKIPQIPGARLPETIAGKFAEIDLNKIAEEQKNAVIDPTMIQDLGKNARKALSVYFEDKTYFSEPKAEELKGLPEGYKGEQFTRFAINPQNFDKAFTTVMDKIAPAFIDLLLKNDALMKAFQFNKEELESAKKELADKKDGELLKTAEELKTSLSGDELDFTGGIQDGYLNYQELQLNFNKKAAAQKLPKIAAHFEIFYGEINTDVKFEYELPKDAVPIQQVQSLLGMSGS